MNRHSLEHEIEELGPDDAEDRIFTDVAHRIPRFIVSSPGGAGK